MLATLPLVQGHRGQNIEFPLRHIQRVERGLIHMRQQRKNIDLSLPLWVHNSAPSSLVVAMIIESTMEKPIYMLPVFSG
jgi:hypothetical protein